MAVERTIIAMEPIRQFLAFMILLFLLGVAKIAIDAEKITPENSLPMRLARPIMPQSRRAGKTFR